MWREPKPNIYFLKKKLVRFISRWEKVCFSKTIIQVPKCNFRFFSQSFLLCSIDANKNFQMKFFLAKRMRRSSIKRSLQLEFPFNLKGMHNLETILGLILPILCTAIATVDLRQFVWQTVKSVQHKSWVKLIVVST